jgi:hypothetical protein
MATSEIDIKVKGTEQLVAADNAIEKGANSVEKLSRQLRAVKEELATLDPNTAKFQELSVEAGALKDQMNDAAEAMNANAGTAFEALGNNASLLTQRLGSLDFEGVGQSVKGMAASIGRVSFKEIVGGIKSMGSALGTLGKALLTNPIFLIAGVLALIATNLDTVAKIIPGVGTAMDSLKESITGVSSEMNKALEESKALTAEAQKQLDTTSASENILKLQGKSEKEILQLKIAQTKSLIDGLKAQISSQEVINKAQIEAATRNKEILKGVLQFITAPLQVLLGTVDQVGKALGQEFGLRDSFNENVSNLFFDPEQTKKDGEAALEEQRKQLLALENNVAGYQLSINSINKSAADARKATREKELESIKAANEYERKLANELLELRLSAEKQLAEERAKMDAEQEAKVQAAYDKYVQTELDRESLRKSLLQTEIEAEIAAVDAKYVELNRLAHGDAELRKQLAEQNAKEVADIEEKYAKQSRDQKISLAQGAVDALLQLNDALQNGSEKSAKRAFTVNKALSLAMALTNTYLGASAAFAQTTGGIGVKLAAAGVATISGLANVARIAKTKFTPSGGGGDTGGGGGSSSSFSAPSSEGGGGGSAPSFNAFNPAFINNRPSQLTPVQAYVLSGNVADELEASTKIKDKARL